jgi:hypothetical protein
MTARIRFSSPRPARLPPSGRRCRPVSEHEFRIMSRLPNERLLRPRDMVENDRGVELGTGSVGTDTEQLIAAFTAGTSEQKSADRNGINKGIVERPTRPCGTDVQTITRVSTKNPHRTPCRGPPRRKGG